MKNFDQKVLILMAFQPYFMIEVWQLHFYGFVYLFLKWFLFAHGPFEYK